MTQSAFEFKKNILQTQKETEKLNGDWRIPTHVTKISLHRDRFHVIDSKLCESLSANHIQTIVVPTRYST